MELMSPLDSVFLAIESREHPMHVGGLQLFEPPEGAGPEFAREVRDALVANRDFQPTFRKHPAWTFGAVPSFAWTYDDPDDVDIDYHVRRSALPTPGRVRELLELTSRWHSGLLDRHRPLWEAHFVEGLNDGRFAVYSKFHHSLIDGVSALRLMQRTLSDDPDDTEMKAIWDLPRRHRENAGKSKRPGLTDIAKSVVAYGPSTWSLARAALLEQQLTLPFAAPRTMFNVPIGGARRVAAQSWAIDRLKAIKVAAGVTFNDVILGMCSGALRHYLQDEHALPDNPLIAMVPVSMRTEDEADSGGNQVAALLCNLATDLDDPVQRLETISASMRGNKKVFSELPKLQAYALSAALISPLGLSSLPGIVRASPPPFNIVISNVPGPTKPMYWNGARLDGNYPLSIALDGQALNITMVNNADNIDFGLVGCRKSVPHLQRLLGHLETSLKDLERAVGV
ncbi:WS/DGAT/MGAT family O-acyltransferase [Mycobacterium paraterrae]|uniref:Diacylglycerol O-acyltransferase n=1 Tax=Mycobacterium paraterrae TaxID=577492 RepID=A0ABY3VL16_9MYCO|nr:wax ester/triacylglycerol synthase family O-acyltransferase [Mycobacterium paraterrae]UMB69952.1 wax ester/triacylglycerol synthase family O-acyltransferase [Mycobacterium paraterrae]